MSDIHKVMIFWTSLPRSEILKHLHLEL